MICRAIAVAVVALVALPCVACRAKPRLAADPSPKPAEVLLSDVAILDVASGERTAGLDVLVRAGHIERIAATGPIELRAGVTVIRGTGATLLPGLVDLHAHPGTSAEPTTMFSRPDPAANLRAYLYCGVTTVVDLGDLGTWSLERRDAVAKGDLFGPTLYAAGPVVTARGGHPVGVLELVLPFWLRWYAIPRYAIEVDTPAEAAAAAEQVAEWGADFLKVIVDRIPPGAPRISEDSLRAAVHVASRRGLRTVAHIGTTDDAVDAARAGVAAWAHGVYRERIPDDRIGEMASFGIPMVPTIVVFEALSRRGETGRQATQLERETVPAEVLAAVGELPTDPDQASFFAQTSRALSEQRANWRDNVRRLHRAGVTILAGSDMQSGVFPGAGLHRELAYLHESGLSNVEVIRAATLDAARFLEARDDPSFGLVAVGKRADLLLVDGDPREDLNHLGRIRAVVVRGVPVERSPLTP